SAGYGPLSPDPQRRIRSRVKALWRAIRSRALEASVRRRSVAAFDQLPVIDDQFSNSSGQLPYAPTSGRSLNILKASSIRIICNETKQPRPFYSQSIRQIFELNT